MKLTAPLHNQRGVTLMVVLVAVVVTGLMAGIAGSTWTTVMQRMREAELLWRGDQYRRAIESYYKMTHGGAKASYPNALEDLLRDSRSQQTVRHIRQLYKDPFTGEDFELIRAGGQISGLPGGSTAAGTGGITGVRSTSRKEPFKKDGFPKEYQRFRDRFSYREWEFVYVPSTPAKPAQPPGQGGMGFPTPPGPGGAGSPTPPQQGGTGFPAPPGQGGTGFPAPPGH